MSNNYQPIEFLEKIIESLNGGNPAYEEIRRNLSCQLLADEEAANGCGLLLANQDGSVRNRLNAICVSINDTAFFEKLPTTRLRAKTIQWYHKYAPEFQKPEARGKFNELLLKYQEVFSDSVWKKVEEIPRPTTGGTPKVQSAAWDLLKETNNDLAILVESAIAAGSKFQRPGIALLVDTLLELCSGSLESDVPNQKSPNPRLPGHTWILIAIDNPGPEDPPGLLLRLRIEKIPNGCGAIYPHPRMAAHLNFTKSFAAGIRNAWAMVRISEGTIQTFDFRWWVTVVEPTSAVQPLSTWLIGRSIDGESATLAFALALKSVIRNETLRRDLATSACFRDTSKTNDDFGWGDILNRISNNSSDIPLFPVGSFSSKDQVIKLCKKAEVDIQKIVTASGQTARLPSSNETIPESTFLNAYREFSEVERWLSDFADLVAGRWQELVDSGKQPGN